jgi:hypothetical protein
MGERVEHPSRIQKKRPNSKFAQGSKAYEERQRTLAKIVARMGAGKSFSDIQAGA